MTTTTNMTATDEALAQRLRHRLDHLTKPLGSLGRLEALALQIGLIQQTDSPQLIEPQLVVFAADHGLAAQGVSAFPSEVTAQMVENFLAGGAAVSVLARQHGLALTVVDAGVRSVVAPREHLLVRKVAAGTADASLGSAMTAAQCEAALEHGRDVVRGLAGNALLLGEMGIGNTSSAAMLVARLCDVEIARCVGRGTGLDDKGLAHKLAVLRGVLDRHSNAHEPLEA
jgi:nicotinate-nucleotide--dimethylbenzimidazole phosphoribosyltransferase